MKPSSSTATIIALGVSSHSGGDLSGVRLDMLFTFSYNISEPVKSP